MAPATPETMRVEIQTGKPVKDKDIQALYLIDKAMRISTPRMRKTNFLFVYDKLIRGDYEFEVKNYTS
jgi:hypothetical protein